MDEPIPDAEAEVDEFDRNLWGRLTPEYQLSVFRAVRLSAGPLPRGRHQIRGRDSPLLWERRQREQEGFVLRRCDLMTAGRWSPETSDQLSAGSVSYKNSRHFII